MIVQKDAVARLLQDGDPDTVRLVKEQLLLGGEENLRDLEELANREEEGISRHARDVLEAIRQSEAEESFDLLCRFFCDCCEIEPTLWHLAPAINPSIDPAPFQRKIDQWGRQFAVKISDAVGSRERVLALSAFMAGELCFRGNSEDYYCERNSLLPCVMETRMGLPLTLVMLYRMVALRAGMLVDGINLPGHFIARHEDVIFDPFHRGKILTRADCEAILQKQNLKLRGCHLVPATPRQILIRTLANLLYVYDLRGETEPHAKVDAWLHILCEGR